MASRSYGPLLMAPFVALALLLTVGFTIAYWGHMFATGADPQTAAAVTHLTDQSTPQGLATAVGAGAEPLEGSEEPRKAPGQPVAQPAAQQ